MVVFRNNYQYCGVLFQVDIASPRSFIGDRNDIFQYS